MLEACRGSAFITQLLTCFKDNVHIFMLQEYLPGGDLFQYLKANGRMDREAATYYAAQVCLGISFLHSRRIIHRDIKPENIFLDINGHAKLGDLGYAKEMSSPTTTTFCGTPSYLAPEMLKQRPYGFGVDWWAFGVLVFQLNSAMSPFQEKHASDTFARILAGNIRWPTQNLFSPSCRNLIESLLTSSVSKRLNQTQIKEHEWFNGVEWDTMEMGLVPPPAQVFNNIRMHALLNDPDNHFSSKRAKVPEISTNIKEVISPDLFADF